MQYSGEAITSGAAIGRNVPTEPTIKDDVDRGLKMMAELLARMDALRERCGISSSHPPSPVAGQIHPDGLRSRVVDLCGNINSAHTIMQDLERIA